MSNQYANSIAKQQMNDLIKKQKELLLFLEEIDRKLEEDNLPSQGLEVGLAELNEALYNFVDMTYDVFEAAGLAEEEEEEEEEKEEEEEEEEEAFFDCDEFEDETRQFTAEECEEEEIRRDVAMMARLQEQCRAYFEEGIIPEDSLGRAYALDYYDASTSADLVKTEDELSCEEESRSRKRKADEDDDDNDEEQVRAPKRRHL